MSKDPRIVYLQTALLADEDKLAESGVKVGILGLSREDFDAMLVPMSEGDEQGSKDSDGEKRHSSVLGKLHRKMVRDKSLVYVLCAALLGEMSRNTYGKYQFNSFFG